MSKVPSKKPAKKAKPKKMGRRLGLFALFLFVAATLAAGVYFMLLYPGQQPERAVPELSGQTKSKPLQQAAEPLPEPPRPEPPVVTQSKTPEENPLPDKPLVAIVIDDMGYRQDTGKALLALDLPLSFSFLPFTTFSDTLQKEAQSRGRDILLHLTLEPMDPKWKLGPDALTTSMDPETMKTIFHKDLRAVPKAIGINNHMGSRFTADPQAMRTLLSFIRSSGLFFLDSATTSQSVAYDLSREMGIKTVRRAVFLDNDQNPDKIRAQLDLLVRLAEKNGQAVGIGHPHPATAEALRLYQNELRTRTEMVCIHSLAK